MAGPAKVTVRVQADRDSASVHVRVDLSDWSTYGNRFPMVGVVEKAMLEARKTTVAVMAEAERESLR